MLIWLALAVAGIGCFCCRQLLMLLQLRQLLCTLPVLLLQLWRDIDRPPLQQRLPILQKRLPILCSHMLIT